MRKILLLVALALVLLSGCSKPWNVAVRFEGGTTNPETPIMVKARSGQGKVLFQGVLQKRCLAVSLGPLHAGAEHVSIEVSDAVGAPLGAVSLSSGDRQLHYLPVNGQLGVITVQSGKVCE